MKSVCNETVSRTLDEKATALQEHEQYFRQFVMGCPLPMAIGRPDGAIELVNDRFVATTGYTLEDIPTIESWWRLACPDPVYREEVIHAWQAAAAGAADAAGAVRGAGECRVTCKDGTVRTMEIRGAPIANRLLVIFVDLTERTQAEERSRRFAAELEQQVQERTAQLEAANRELEAFSYSVSHDLRAPLRAIEGFSGIVAEEYGRRLDAEGRRLLGTIRANARRMSRLIDDLLTFSRTGRSELRRVRIDMGKMARSAFEEVVAQPGARARIAFTARDLPEAEADAALIRQVWVNLLSNAVKFSAPTARPVIEVSGASDGNEIVYRVRDNGVGFDGEYAGQLFGVFQRLHPASEFEGTGIGLALVRRILARHGGRVWAEGAVNAGATFFFSLPGPPPVSL